MFFLSGHTIQKNQYHGDEPMWQLLAPLVSPIINKLVDRIPNSNDRARAKEEFEKELMSAVNQATQGQIEINKMEAQHASVFVAGWRPFIGWVCGFALMWNFVGHPIVYWAVITFMKTPVALPVIDAEGLYQLVFAMLGMGGLRTMEKLKGVSRETPVIVFKQNKG